MGNYRILINRSYKQSLNRLMNSFDGLIVRVFFLRAVTLIIYR